LEVYQVWYLGGGKLNHQLVIVTGPFHYIPATRKKELAMRKQGMGSLFKLLTSLKSKNHVTKKEE